jgi:hypothetical protein
MQMRERQADLKLRAQTLLPASFQVALAYSRLHDLLWSSLGQSSALETTS